MTRRNLILLVAMAVVGLTPFLMPSADGGLFNGTDSMARDMILRDHPDYHAWAGPLWSPPSTEVESLLFALQAAAGAGVLGYYLGLRRGRSRRAVPEETARARHASY